MLERQEEDNSSTEHTQKPQSKLSESDLDFFGKKKPIKTVPTSNSHNEIITNSQSSEKDVKMDKELDNASDLINLLLNNRKAEEQIENEEQEIVESNYRYFNTSPTKEKKKTSQTKKDDLFKVPLAPSKKRQRVGEDADSDLDELDLEAHLKKTPPKTNSKAKRFVF
eukprot:TRINITY_DN17730_c0_g1_i1.p1 TRINITY_DN17730_c0_g1~~TRINITY_DN17730_c0_g1_i1.p1  ORF type:complete len:167 (-),score=54.26 TRINITY_DN17730_c0_g1_i1:35-535(-)